MTFQPPPPPPPPPSGPPTPPPPPPGQWGPPPGQGPSSGGGFDPKSVDRLDWGILGAGVIAFLFSFISYYDGGDVTSGGHTVTVSGVSFSAWHEIFGGGFFGWFAMLFALAGAVITGMALFQPNVKMPIANRLLTLYLFLAAALCVIIAIFVTPGADDSFGGVGVSVSLNHGVGFWISFIVIIGGAVLALMRAQQTNTAMPGAFNNLPKIGK